MVNENNADRAFAMGGLFGTGFCCYNHSRSKGRREFFGERKVSK